MRTHLTLDDMIRQEKQVQALKGVHPGCATTLISAHCHERKLRFVSTGDSLIYLLREGDLIDINQNRTGLFLGDSHNHVLQVSRKLRRLGCIDAMTEQSQVVAIVGHLADAHAMLKAGKASKAAMGTLIQRISAIVGFPIPLKPEALMSESGELQIQLATTLPESGTVTLKPGDLLLIATDGLEAEVSGCSLETVREVLATAAPSLEKKAAYLLKKCLGWHGGGDNLTVFLAQF